MEIKDRIAIITGGGGGIGSATARKWIAEGARAVVVADYDEEAASSVAGELGCVGVGLDVTDEAAIGQLIEETESTLGPVDIFFSNAGAGAQGGVEASNEAWQSQWELHVMSHVYAARAVLPSMTARGDGYLIHTASAAGLLAAVGSAPSSSPLSLASTSPTTAGCCSFACSGTAASVLAAAGAELFPRGPARVAWRKRRIGLIQF